MATYEEEVERWKKDQGDSVWTGVDLDGTLAIHGVWMGPLHIGKPIPKMVARVKAMLAAGNRVKVFTARMCEPDPDLRAAIGVAIGDWTERVVGQRLEATNQKDYDMVELFDDRAVQIIGNTGVRADGKE